VTVAVAVANAVANAMTVALAVAVAMAVAMAGPTYRHHHREAIARTPVLVVGRGVIWNDDVLLHFSGDFSPVRRVCAKPPEQQHDSCHRQNLLSKKHRRTIVSRYRSSLFSSLRRSRIAASAQRFDGPAAGRKQSQYMSKARLRRPNCAQPNNRPTRSETMRAAAGCRG
jgi:hypothetical protein